TAGRCIRCRTSFRSSWNDRCAESCEPITTRAVRRTADGATNSVGIGPLPSPALPGHSSERIRYFYWCATHGVFDSLPVDALRAPPPRSCPTCAGVAEIWVGDRRDVQAAVDDEALSRAELEERPLGDQPA